jgi:hypothetical protein
MKLARLDASINVAGSALRERGGLIRREHQDLSTAGPAPGANRPARQMDSCELMRLHDYCCFSFDSHGPILNCFVRVQAIGYNPFSKTAQSIQGLPPKSPKSEANRSKEFQSDEGTRSQRLHFRGI